MNKNLASIGFFAAVGACATPILSPDETAIREVRLNEAAQLGGVQVTPTNVIEDSRCPLGVQCIQAGTVRIEARIAHGATARNAILGLGVPTRSESGWISLIQACPYPVHGAPIAPGAYRFRLMLTTGEAPAVIDPPVCPRP